jgi:hypothetical protein
MEIHAVVDPPDGSAEREAMKAHVEMSGVVRLTWTTGTQITEQLARDATDRVNDINMGRACPLLVDMRGVLGLNREARLAFAADASATRIALLGQSVVDRVLGNFGLGLNTVPTRYFTSESAALAWLHDAHGG